MINKIVNRILSLSRILFYEEISPKFKKNSLKTFIDYSYIIFEKIAINFNIISLNYINLYRDIVQKEIKMARIKKSDTIIVIGCGTLPSTPILISEKTNAKIVALDKDRKAIDKAKIFLSNIHMDKKIKLIYANGLNYPIEKYDVIILLYGLKDIKKFFSYLYKNIKSNTKIIVRTNNEADINLFKNFKVIKHAESKYFGQVFSYLISK
jgi:ubiquinone/menaquinone biosynthesis C-methylase UbiE